MLSLRGKGVSIIIVEFWVTMNSVVIPSTLFRPTSTGIMQRSVNPPLPPPRYAMS